MEYLQSKMTAAKTKLENMRWAIHLSSQNINSQTAYFTLWCFIRRELTGQLRQQVKTIERIQAAIDAVPKRLQQQQEDEKREA
jgi:sensor domain CHASE-containing protein